ncbi:MAG TPA: hypothetical protein VFH57_02470 [Gammaproteobacteria bacterium]|nr:hypothetical protein [Gammaproteobacteria bacterium]
MARAIIHIGLHKTGSTSIQQTFYKCASTFATEGCIYPIHGTRWYGHHPLAWAAGAVHPSQREINANDLVERYLRATGDETLVLSSEDFYRVPLPNGSRVLQSLFEHFEKIDVVIYIRHPVEWVVSSYKWNVEKDPCRFSSFEDFLSRCNLEGWFNFTGRLDAWSKIPNSRLNVRAYVPDVVGDFSAFCGIRNTPAISSTNVSVRGISTILTTAIAATLPSGPPRGLTSHIDKMVCEKTERDINLVSREKYEEIMQLCRERFLSLFASYPFEGMHDLLENRWQPGTMDSSEVMTLCQAVLDKLPKLSRVPGALDGITRRLQTRMLQ